MPAPHSHTAGKAPMGSSQGLSLRLRITIVWVGEVARTVPTKTSSKLQIYYVQSGEVQAQSQDDRIPDR